MSHAVLLLRILVCCLVWRVHSALGTCSPQQDGLFVADPSDRLAFLRCRSYPESPSVGYWERHFCPNDMHFEYDTQQCTLNLLPPNIVREANELFQIAILNGSCAHGEHCIGGTVCDPAQQRCLCPYGTVALLESLSCARLADQQQLMQMAGLYRLYPQPQHQWRAQSYGPYVSQISSPSSAVVVSPGASCERGELCGGGAMCVPHLGVCICPLGTEQLSGAARCTPITNGAKMEAASSRLGQQQSAKELVGQNGYIKVSLGDRCNEYLGIFCADTNARCADTRCQCVAGWVEQNGRCQVAPQRRESGPGEPCSGGQVCVRGSMCSRQIPICVCPQGTELDSSSGWCVQQQPTTTTAATTTPAALMVSIASEEVVPSTSTVASPRKRQREATMGEKCSLNADCMMGAYCNGNTQPPTCQCLSTHVNVNERCQKVIYPGQRGCETDLQCSAGYAGTRCIGRQCVCPPGSTAIDQTCIPAIAWPGDACNISQLIPVCSADSHCSEGRCVCNPPMRLLQKQCVHPHKEGTKLVCQRDANCPKGEFCNDDGKCDRCEEAGEAQGKRTRSRLGGKCVRLDEFGGTFITRGGVPLEDDENGNSAEESELEWRREGNGVKERDKETEGGKLSIKATRGNTLDDEAENGKRDSVLVDERRNGQRAEESRWHNEARGKQKDRTSRPEEEANRLGPRVAPLGNALDEDGARILRKDLKWHGGRNASRERDKELSPEADDRTPQNRKSALVTIERRREFLAPNRTSESARIGSGIPSSTGAPKAESTRSGHAALLGIEQIFSTLALLKRAAMDTGKEPLTNGTAVHREYPHSRALPSAERHRRGLAKSGTKKTPRSAGLPHHHRLEGEPCSPGHVCLNGTACVNGHCRRDADGTPTKNNNQSSDWQTALSSAAATFRAIGAKCTQGHDRCMGGSVCRQSVCTCADGSAPDADKSRCRQTPGGRCSHGQMCSGQSDCRLGTCQCRAGMKTTREPPRKCVRAVAWPGENCDAGQKCLGGSKCTFGTCLCPANHSVLANGTRCEKSDGVEAVLKSPVRDAPEGQEKAGDATTTVKPTAQSTSTGREWEGAAGGVQPDNDAPLGKSAPGQLCVSGGTECTGGSRCENSICTCPEGSTLFRDECLPSRAKLSMDRFRAQAALFSPEPGSSSSVSNDSPAPLSDESLQDPVPNKTVAPGAMCRLPLECPYRTECVRGVCRCQKGETIVNGICRKTIHEVLPGGRCDTQKGLDCVGESHCFYGICVCLYGLVSVGSECANANVLERVEPGKSCSLGQNCRGRAKCVRGKCQCPKGQVADPELKRCVKSAVQVFEHPPVEKTEDPSTIHIPLPGAKKATAPPVPKFVYAIPAALAAAAEEGKFNQILTANQMSINLLDQNTLRALLASALTAQLQRQQPRRSDSAQNAQQCQDGANCQFGQQQPTSPSSLPLSVVSQLVAPPPHQQHFPALNSASPLPLIGQPGHFCAPPNQLCTGGAVCLAGLCVCRPGFRPLDTLCQIAPVELGEQCFLDEQCKQHGFCIDGICRCSASDRNALPTAFHRFGRACASRPMAQVGADCTRGQACGWNSVCGAYSGVCECAVGMENNRQGACVAARRPRGVECLSSSNCHKWGFCDNGYCVCRSGHEQVGGFCLPPAQPVIDDPKAFIDPETMAALLKKEGRPENSPLSPFGGKFFSRLPNSGGGEDNSFQNNNVGGIWTDGAQRQEHNWLTTDERRTPTEDRMDLVEGGTTDNSLTENAGWPFSIGHSTGNSWNWNAFTAQPQRQRGQMFRQQNAPPFEGESAVANALLANDAAAPAEAPLTRQISAPSVLQHFPAQLRPNKLHTDRTLSLTRGRGKNKHKRGRKVHHQGEQPHSRGGVAMPGEYCGTRERECIGNSECIRGWCQCAEGVHVQKEGLCASAPHPPPKSPTPSPNLTQRGHREPRRPFESCFANGICIQGANCIRSAALPTVQKLGPYCQCMPGAVFLQEQCVPRRPEMQVAPIGAHCSAHTICDSGSVCGEEHICKCPEDKKHAAGLCVNVALPGESCAHGQFCAEGAICAPGLDACVCQVGWHARKGKCRRGGGKLARRGKGRRENARQQMLLPDVEEAAEQEEAPATESDGTSPPPPKMLNLVVPLGEACQHDSDCSHVAHAHCSPASRRCACSHGFLQLYASICVPAERVRLPGEECVANAHFCTANSWCKEGRCECIQRNARASKGRCEPIPEPPLEPPAEESGPILALRRRRPIQQHTSATICQEQHCPLGTVCEAESGDCFCNGRIVEPTTEKGARCALNTDCRQPLECIEGRCACDRRVNDIRQIGEPVEKGENSIIDEDEKEKEEGKNDEEGGVAGTEWDYALGEPVAGPILPGTFCDAFSRCGEGAECLFGRCQCIVRGQHLSFVGGTTMCVDDAEKKGHEEDGLEKTNELPIRQKRMSDSTGTRNYFGAEKRRERLDQRVSRRVKFRPNETTHRPSSAENRSNNGHQKGQLTQQRIVRLDSSNDALQPMSSPQKTHSSTERKVVSPGALCGPLDVCAGGASCVEGLCLCPAGTRPSPTGNNNCEPLERRLAHATTTTQRAPRPEENTQPAPIHSNNRTQLPNTDTNAVQQQLLLTQTTMPSTTTPPNEEQPKNPIDGLLPSLTVLTTDNRSNETTLDKVGEIICRARLNVLTQPTEAGSFAPNTTNTSTETNRANLLLVNVKGVRRKATPSRSSRNRAYARPSESCATGEICTGGSLCQESTKICECPTSKPLLRNHICVHNIAEPPQKDAARPGEACNSETKCTGDLSCVNGLCSCENGSTVVDGARCVKRESGVLPLVQLAEEEGDREQSNAQQEVPTSPSASPFGHQLSSHPKPKISGPPLRKAGLSTAPAGTAGVCPPGNVPLTDTASGLLIQCNGMTPNCPPKSYCFVTGVASETYNCCKAY